jgi:hypothetical protein
MLAIAMIRNDQLDNPGGFQSEHRVRNPSGLGASSPQLFSMSGLLQFLKPPIRFLRWLAQAAMIGAAASVSASPACADVKYFPKTQDRPATIFIYGTITGDDVEPFNAALVAIEAKDEAFVALSSEGGFGIAALEIGDMVRRSGIKTWVSDDQTCASACSVIWIAGSQKWAGSNSHIGFHGIFDKDTGQQIALPNALLGAHYAYLGYGPETIVWLISARGADMHWLTPETAKKYDIYFAYDEKTPPTSPQYVYVPPSSTPASRSNPSAEASVQFSYRVTQNLNLRSKPDKSSYNMLANYAPNDFIPEGTIFTWKGRPNAGNNCTTGAGEEIWCHLTYNHDNGIKTDGWVSAHFLRSTTSQIMLACLFQNPDPECTDDGAAPWFR